MAAAIAKAALRDYGLRREHERYVGSVANRSSGALQALFLF